MLTNRLVIDTDVTVTFVGFYVPVSVAPTVSFDCPINLDIVKNILGSNAEPILNRFNCNSGSNSRRARSNIAFPLPDSLVQNYARSLIASAMNGDVHSGL